MKVRTCTLLTLLLFAMTSLHAGNYPENLYDRSKPVLQVWDSVDMQYLSDFLDDWGSPEGFPSATLEGLSAGMQEQIEQEDISLSELRTLYRVQQAQLEQLMDQSRPVLSLRTDPMNSPLYSYSHGTYTDYTLTPPDDVIYDSHSFGLGAGFSQQLPTAGSLDLSVSNSSTVTGTGDDWTWEQNPRFSASLSQPLFIGEQLLDTSYGDRVLERSQLQQQATTVSIESLRGQLLLQGLGLELLHQQLIESIWLLNRRLEISEREKRRVETDFIDGLVSAKQVEIQRTVYDALQRQLQRLQYERESAADSLRRMWGREEGEHEYPVIIPQLDQLERFFDAGSRGLTSDQMLFVEMLSSDARYQQAMLDFSVAELDRDLGSPLDAPLLSLSLDAGLSYTDDGDKTFSDSITELFGGSELGVSFSILFQAGDLSRSAAKTAESISKEQMLQAGKAAAAASEDVLNQIDALQRSYDSLALDLGSAVSDHLLSVQAYEDEKILSQVGEATEDSVNSRYVDMVEDAFSVLQILRSMDLEVLRLEILRGDS